MSDTSGAPKPKTRLLREMLARPGAIAAPSCWDAVTAKLLQKAGLPIAYVGGWVTGAKLGTTEPLVTLTEQVAVASYVNRAVDLPVICDGDSGFGDAIHVHRTVEEFEAAGIAGIHIEDQVFPKRAHYHRGVEHVIPVEEMVAKIKIAVQARRDKDFLIIARTDAKPATGSIEETIRRVNLYAEAGADMVLPLRLSEPKEAERVRRETGDIPLMWLSYFGGLSVKQVEALGFKLIVYPLAAMIAAARTYQSIYRQVAERGIIDQVDVADMAAARMEIEEMIGLPKLWAIEELTTEA